MKTFLPNIDTDPEFAGALLMAKNAGVDVFAYECTVTENSIEISKSIDVVI